jgi:hypothetical protein
MPRFLFHVSGNSVPELRQQMNNVLSQISVALQRIEGLDSATPNFYNTIQMNAKKIINQAAGTATTDSANLSNVNSFSGDVVITGSFTTDNIKIDGNTISSINTNGNIVFAPNGTGEVSMGATPLSCGDITITGIHQINHTAIIADDHAVEIDCDAAGFGDVKAIDIDYITGSLVTGEDEAVILINIDEFATTGGDINGLEVLATDALSGGAVIHAVKAGALVAPIQQDSGTFANPTTGTNDTTSTDVAAMIDGSEGTSTTIFVADNDYILIGAAAPFTEIEFDIETPAGSPGIQPTFGYSTAGSHTFTTFSPVDGTNGFKNNGVIAWDAADLTSHGVNTDTSTYDIKITRTHASNGNVSLFFAKTAATVVYSWSKDGDVSVKNVTVASFFQDSVAAAVTAHTGSSQGDGPITTGVVELTVVANPGDAATLPTAVAGMNVFIINEAANSADIFPATGAQIDSGGANTAKAQAGGTNRLYKAINSTTWHTL